MNLFNKLVAVLLLTLYLGLVGSSNAFAQNKVVVIPLGSDPVESPQTKTSFVTGQSNDGRDNGPVSQRVLDFTKVSATSDLRISYTDNFRVFKSTAGSIQCDWEILIDDLSCPSGELKYRRVDSTDQAFHSSSTVVGYCQGLSSGDYNITVNVSSIGADCFTGLESTFLLEAKEVN